MNNASREARARANVSYVEPDEDEFLAPNKRAAPPQKDEDVSRKSSRVDPRKTSPLDVLACAERVVPGGPGLTYTVGGAEAGGIDAERVLREVEIDDAALNLTGQFLVCRRIVLFRSGRVVAAAVFELHATANVLEIPIFASSRAHRQQGNGSVLLALLVELAVRHLNAKVVVVSATNESRRFWLSMGLHVAAHCPPPVSAALRYLKAHGYVAMGFYSSTTQMAKALPPAVSEAGELVKMALQRAASKTTKSRDGLSAARVADVLGYTDLAAGTPSFVLERASGARVPLGYGAAGARQSGVQPWRLQAFERTEGGGAGVGVSGWGEPGWGVRCSTALEKGQVVVEVTGEWLNEEAHKSRTDVRFMLPLDDKTARREGVAPTFLDLREAGSLARLVSVCVEAPNLELLLIPTGVAAPMPAPLMPAPMPALPPPAASTEGATAEAAEGDVPMTDGAAPETASSSAAVMHALNAALEDAPVVAAPAALPAPAPAPPMPMPVLTTASAPPMLVRAYLVARHDIPPMVELTWAGPSGHTARQSVSSAKAADAATAAAADETPDAMAAEPGKLAYLARAAACEVRQHEPGLKGNDCMLIAC